MPAPIILFVYSRCEHTRHTVEALLGNTLADESELIIYSDAARTPEKLEDVSAVRRYISAISGFRSITIIEREQNMGLANSIIQGVSEVLEQHESAIVLEDDMITSPHFLRYMNDGLDRYVNDERVISIHGYSYPVNSTLPEAFFLLGADCWGWATWQRGWQLFNPDGAHLLQSLRERKLERAFDFNDSYPYVKMLEKQISGANDSWAIRWYASAFLLGKLTLYPGRSLVHNIGNDASGTHCDTSTVLDVHLSTSPIMLDGIDVVPSDYARHEFESFFKRMSYIGIHERIVQGSRRLLKRIFP
jgi:hypothetical protein